MILNKFVIGVTGGSGVGKTVASRALQEIGAYIINADEVGHRVILKGNEAYLDIIDHFGWDVLDKNDEIDRKKLGKIVFNDREKLQILSEITHEHIALQIGMEIFHSKRDFIVIDAPLLIGSGLERFCYKIIGIFAPHDLRISRICERDGVSFKDAESRINSQMSDIELGRYVDIKIYNDCDLEEFEIKVKKAVQSA